MTFRRFLHESRLTLALASPIMAGQAGQHLMGIADSIMLGKVGVLPLAASAFAQNIFIILAIGLLGMLTPISVLASRAFGAQQHSESGEILRHGLWIGGVVGILSTIFVVTCLPMLKFFGQNEDVLRASEPFLVLLAGSLLPMLIFQVLKNYCEALAAPIPPMLMMLGGVILNIFLNWILIFGNWGSPALGLVGAGIATLTSRCVIAIALLIYVISSKRFRLHLPLKWMTYPEWNRVAQMIKLGVPMGGQLFVETSAFAIGGIILGWISAEALAAHQIVISCGAISFMISVGVSTAASIRVGHYIGEHKYHHLKSIGISSFAITSIIMGTVGIVFLFFGKGIAHLFIHDDITVRLATQMFIAAGVFQLMDGLQAVGIGLLRGLRDVIKPLLIALASYWVVMLPLGYWLSFHTLLGPVGMWCGFVTGLAVAATLLVTRFLWKTAFSRIHLLQ